MNEEVVQILKENQKLLKSQAKAAKFRNTILVVIEAVIIITSVFVINRINEAMVVVSEIEQLTVQIEDEVAAIDEDSLNTTISNLESITTDLKSTIQRLEKNTQLITDFIMF